MNLRSGEGLLDWTCILVGSSTGKLRMYTENGTLLNTQIFHTGEILKIKCRTYEPAKYIGWIQQVNKTASHLICLICSNHSNIFKSLRKSRYSMPTTSLSVLMVATCITTFAWLESTRLAGLMIITK